MSGSEQLRQLERLEKLHAAGALNDTEFKAEKARLLNQGKAKPGIDWRLIWRNVTFIAVFGIVAITVLLVMPAPKRAIDDPGKSPVVGQPAATAKVPGSGTSMAPTSVPTPQPEASPAEGDQTYVEPKPIKGRCLLRIKGKSYIDGVCDIVMEQDGSFDVIEHYDQAGYFAKVLRDGASAHGYWNGARDSMHAQDDLGDLTRNGACWENATAKICAWS